MRFTKISSCRLRRLKTTGKYLYVQIKGNTRSAGWVSNGYLRSSFNWSVDWLLFRDSHCGDFIASLRASDSFVTLCIHFNGWLESHGERDVDLQANYSVRC